MRSYVTNARALFYWYNLCSWRHLKFYARSTPRYCLQLQPHKKNVFNQDHDISQLQREWKKKIIMKKEKHAKNIQHGMARSNGHKQKTCQRYSAFNTSILLTHFKKKRKNLSKRKKRTCKIYCVDTRTLNIADMNSAPVPGC